MKVSSEQIQKRGIDGAEERRNSEGEPEGRKREKRESIDDP